MPNPARFSVERPKIVGLFTLLLMIYGVLSYQGLPRQENPTLQERYASIITYLPGAEPEKVELLVSEVIEDAIAELDDIHEIFSRSTYGVSWMLVEIEKSAPAAERLQEVRDKVREAESRFPAGTSQPDIDIRVFRTNTMLLALVGESVPPVALREQARALERDLEGLGGVRRVDLVGLPKEEIEVSLDLPRLAQRGLPLGRVIDALAARNVRLPGGELEVGAVRSSIQLSGAFEGVDEVGATLLGSSPDGLPIRLADVAHVQRRVAEPEELVRVGPAQGVGIALEMLPNRNIITMGERVRQHLAELELPEGMRVEVVADEPAYVDARLSLLTDSLLVGLVLVVSLTLLGMGWRSGIVVSLTIPLALLVATGLQGFVNVPLHQISIAALVIAIGIVVDESIVVTDNIQRHIDRGSSPRTAAIEGLGEIHLAVLAGAATTIAAFIPLMVMEGDIGDFIRSIPIVVSLMLLGSVLVSHFVTPLLAMALHGRGGGGSSGPIAVRLEPRYRSFAGWVVQHPHAVLGAFGVWLMATLFMAAIMLWPPLFFPDADRHQFLIKLDLPAGAPVRETDEVVRRVEAMLAEEPEIARWGAFVGRDAPKFYYNEFDDGRAENRSQIIVNTTENVGFSAMRAYATRIGERIRSTVPGVRVRSYPLRQGYGGGEDVEIFITGHDLDVLRSFTARVRAVVESVEGTDNVSDSFGYDPITLVARVDAARANLLEVSHHEVATTLRTAIDGVTATTFRENDQEIDIRVRLAEGQRRSVADLASLPLFSPVQGAVPLSHVASVEAGFTYSTILRFNRKRESVVEADVADGYNLVDVADRVERAVRDTVVIPPDHEIYFFGQRQEVTESFLSLLKAAVVAVFLIYIILVVRFQSLSQPLLILLAVPMSVCGAFWGLAFTGNPVSFMAFLGMISLAGIAVNDSIVLVDTVNRLRENEGDLADAVVEGATTRLRAVLLTSVTTMGGLLPLSISGGEFWAPFGFSMIFGLGASTVLTLVIQPAAYLTLDRRLRRGKPLAAGVVVDKPSA